MPGRRLVPIAQIISPGRLPGIRPFKTEGLNPKDAYGLAKVPLSLVPVAAKVMAAVGLAVGDFKYGAYNWRKTKVRLRVYIEAAQRHLDAILDGEDIDPETGAPHIALLGANYSIIADALYGGAGCVDDRPLPGEGGQLIRDMNDFVKEMSQLTLEANNARSNTKGVHGRSDQHKPSRAIQHAKRGRSKKLGVKGRVQRRGRADRGVGKTVLQSVRNRTKRQPYEG